MTIEIKVPDIGDFKDVPVIEIHVQARPDGQGRGSAGHAGERQGHHGHPGAAGRDRGRAQGQGRRPGGRGGGDPARSSPRVRPRSRPRSKVKEGAAPASGEPAGYGSSAGVYETIEVKVPDIGDFKDVPVIEVHVAEGAAVKAEDPLLTLESDKATMDVPSPAAGTVAGLKVKVGDRVGEGTLILHAADRGRQAGAGRRRAGTRPPPPRRPRPPVPPRATSTPRCWCWAPAPAATPPPSAPPTSAARWCWSSAGRPWAGSASMSAASPPRRCCTPPR